MKLVFYLFLYIEIYFQTTENLSQVASRIALRLPLRTANNERNQSNLNFINLKWLQSRFSDYVVLVNGFSFVVCNRPLCWNRLIDCEQRVPIGCGYLFVCALFALFQFRLITGHTHKCRERRLPSPHPSIHQILDLTWTYRKYLSSLPCRLPMPSCSINEIPFLSSPIDDVAYSMSNKSNRFDLRCLQHYCLRNLF